MKPWHAGKRSLVRRGVGEVENSLEPKRNRLRKADVPVKVRAWEFPPGNSGGIHARLVHVHPDVLAIPELGEAAVNTGGSPVGIQRRVVEQWNPDAVTLDSTVPRVRTVEVGLHKVTDRSYRRAALIGRDGVANHDVAVFVPEGEIVGAKNGFGRRVCRLPGAARVRKGDVQPIDSFGLDLAAILFQDPRLEVFERWLRLQQIVKCFAEPKTQSCEQRIVLNPFRRVPLTCAMAGPERSQMGHVQASVRHGTIFPQSRMKSMRFRLAIDSWLAEYSGHR